MGGPVICFKFKCFTIRECQKLADQKKLPLFDVFNNLSGLDLRNKQVNSLGYFHDLIIKYRELIDKLSPNEFTRSLVEEAGIINFYKSSELPEDAERLQNIYELLNSIDDYASRETNNYPVNNYKIIKSTLKIVSKVSKNKNFYNNLY